MKQTHILLDNRLTLVCDPCHPIKEGAKDSITLKNVSIITTNSPSDIIASYETLVLMKSKIVAFTLVTK